MMNNVMIEKPLSLAVAEAVLSTIKEFYAESESVEDEDDFLETLRQYPAGYAVRSAWTQLGEKLEAAEYCLTIAGGGPAVRIIGSIDLDGDASTAVIQYQDWHTPWTDLDVCGEDEETLLWFAQQVGPFAQPFHA